MVFKLSRLKSFIFFLVAITSQFVGCQILACEIRVAVPGLMSESDPIKAKNWWNKRFVTLQTDTLMRFDSKGVAQPWLAKRWFLSTDKKTLEIEIRNGVLFSDGSPMTSQDVAKSLQRWKDDPTSADGGRLIGIKSIDSNGPNKVSIHLAEAFLPLISYLATARAGIVKVSSGNIIGTGPWKISQIGAESVSFTANNNYFQGNPSCESLKLIHIKNENSLEALKKGDVDIVEYFSNGTASNPEEIQKQVGDSVMVSEFPTYDVTLLLFTNNKATSISLPQRKWLFEKIFQSKDLKYNAFTRLACSFLPLGITASGTNLCAADLSKGIAAVKPTRSIEIFGPEDERIDLVKGISKRLLSLGVQSVIRPTNLKELYKKHGNGEIALHMETFTMQVPDPYGVLSMYKSDAKENFASYSNSKFDKALTKAIAEPNPVRREKNYEDAIKTLANDFMLIPLVNETRFILTRKELEGVEIQSIGPFYSAYHRLKKASGVADGK